MPRIRCRYLDCVFLDDGYCTAELVEVDPDECCLTYTQIDEVEVDKEWEEEEEIEELWDVEEDDLLSDDDDDDDIWLDDDEI